MITEVQAREIVEQLNKKFNCRPCYLHCGNLAYGKSAYYSESNQRIYVAPKSLKEWVIVHEYAHHITAVVNKTKRIILGKRKSIRMYKKEIKEWNFGYKESQIALNAKHAPTRKRMRQEHHGDDFCKVLKKVVVTHYDL